jgi:hypothetical protein
MVIGCAALIVGSWFYTDEVKLRRTEERTDRGLDGGDAPA